MAYKRAFFTTATLMIALVGTSGCSWVGKTFGSNKRAPDEFEVVGKAPLQVPPDFTLRPPRPGEPRPQDVAPSAQAFSALFPGRVSLPKEGSQAEKSLLIDAGVTEANVNVRSDAGDSKTQVVDKGTLTRNVILSEERLNEREGATVEKIDSQPLDDLEK